VELMRSRTATAFLFMVGSWWNVHRNKIKNTIGIKLKKQVGPETAAFRMRAPNRHHASDVL